MNKNLEIGNTYKIIIYSITYGIGFYYLKMFSKQNSWLIVIIANIIGFLFIKMIAKIKEKTPNKSIYEVNKLVLGKSFGTIINMIFSLIFILFTIIILWYLTVFLKTNFLTKTPIIIIELILISPLLYISNKNSILIVKTSCIFAFIIFILTIISIIFLSPQIDLNNLKPFKEISNQDMFRCLFNFTTVTYLPTYAILGTSELKIKNMFKYSIKTLLLTLGITLMTYLVLGNSIVQLVDFPEFFVLRKIGVLSNGTRIDSIIIIGWILSIYIVNATNILFVRNYLKSEIKTYSNYYMYIIVISISLIATKIFKNINVGKLFVLNILPFVLLPIFIINLIILIKIKVKQNVSH